MLIKPFTAMELSCSDCGDETQVVIWNGVGDWAMAPSSELVAQEEAIIVTLKVSPETAQGMAAWIVDTGPHVADRVVAWAKDEATYSLLVKLVSNPASIHRPEERDGPHTAH
jgi:hypothetical protein